MYWHQAAASVWQPLIDATRPGLITDVDGTISPIVADPTAATVTPRNRKLLGLLRSHMALIAFVSGRSVSDIQARVNLPDAVYIGNHGFERWEGGQAVVGSRVQAYRPSLVAALHALKPHADAIPSLEVEDKGATLSIHYRRTEKPMATAAALEPVIEGIAASFKLDLYQGRMVFELRPPLKVNKGTALADLVSQYDLDAAVYLGDDTTDIDALKMARQFRQEGKCYCLGLGVMSSDTPEDVRASADLLVAGVAGVEDFFGWLFDARTASAS